MLPVSLACPFFVAPSVFSNVYLSCVLCVQCYQFHWLFYSSLLLQFSLTCICPVSCVSNVTSFSGLSILRCPFSFLSRLFVLCLVCPMLPVSLACPFFVAPSIFSNVYLSCVLCVQCYQFLWLVHSSLSLQYSLTFICPVSCVSNVASFSGLSIFRCSFSFL
jgi:hypothetical protein